MWSATSAAIRRVAQRAGRSLSRKWWSLRMWLWHEKGGEEREREKESKTGRERERHTSYIHQRRNGFVHPNRLFYRYRAAISRENPHRYMLQSTKWWNMIWFEGTRVPDIYTHTHIHKTHAQRLNTHARRISFPHSTILINRNRDACDVTCETIS